MTLIRIDPRQGDAPKPGLYEVAGRRCGCAPTIGKIKAEGDGIDVHEEIVAAKVLAEAIK